MLFIFVEEIFNRDLPDDKIGSKSDCNVTSTSGDSVSDSAGSLAGEVQETNSIIEDQEVIVDQSCNKNSSVNSSASLQNSNTDSDDRFSSASEFFDCESNSFNLSRKEVM